YTTLFRSGAWMRTERSTRNSSGFIAATMRMPPTMPSAISDIFLNMRFRSVMCCGEVGETGQALAPANDVAALRHGGLGGGVGQAGVDGQARPAIARVLEVHGHQGARRQAGATGVAVLRHADIGDALGDDDFAVAAPAGIGLAIGAGHAEIELAADTKVQRALGVLEAMGAPPGHDMAGIAPSLEDELARRVEDARNDDLAIGRVGDIGLWILVHRRLMPAWVFRR